MNKFKDFIISFLVPITKTWMVNYLRRKGYTIILPKKEK